MPITLDQEPRNFPGGTLGDVLEAAAQSLANDGRIVVEVAIDGAPLSGEEIAQRATTPIVAVDVALTSAAPGELAVDALTHVRGQLQDTKTLAEQAAEDLQSDDAQAAYAKVAQLIETWLLTHQAVEQSIGLLKIDIQTLEFADGQAVSAFAQDLVLRLNELKTAISDSDTVGLADALAYEWPQTIERWEQMIDLLITRAESA